MAGNVWPMRICPFLVVGLACAVPAPGHGDEHEESINRRSFYVSANVSVVPQTDIEQAAGAAAVRDVGRQLAVGFRGLTIGKTDLDVGIDYQYSRYEFDGIQGRDRDLHRFQVPVRLAVGNGEWRTTALLVPGIATSSNIFKDVINRATGDDMTLAGRWLVEKRAQDAAWFAGVAYDQTFGKPKTYPLAGYERDWSSRLRVRIAFPDPGAWYRLSGRFELAARLFPAGQRWHVVSDDFSSDFDYRDEETRFQLTLSTQIGNRWIVDVAGGFAFNRRQVFTDDLGARLNRSIDDAGFFAVGFRYGGAPMPYPNGSGF